MLHRVLLFALAYFGILGVRLFGPRGRRQPPQPRPTAPHTPATAEPAIALATLRPIAPARAPRRSGAWQRGVAHGAVLLGVLAVSPSLTAGRAHPPADPAPTEVSAIRVGLASEPLEASSANAQLPVPARPTDEQPAADASGDEDRPDAPDTSDRGEQHAESRPPNDSVDATALTSADLDADGLGPDGAPDSTDDAPIPAAEGADGDAASVDPPTFYTVAPGDTVNRIAAAYGVSADVIASLNALVRPDHIEIGQRLLLREPPGVDGRIPADSHEAFIFSLVRGARESQRLTGVPASVTLAQAILETYWGTSFLARDANNYFGIKAYEKPGTAGVVWIDAWEVDANGRDVNYPAPFRRYADPADSLVDHGRFFLENSRYAYALQATSDPKEFARRINAAGYATDPNYATKLIAYMDRYNLYQWDVPF
ncbi:MAG TPA: glucosaminidase domain-containing protein [Chloroflexota bacterium]|nr:glucosaminidase domain-containing protein [Chloroflexota bacterium]